MDTNQPTGQTQVFNDYKKPPGIFAGKIPSTVSFIVGILLLLLPFAEIRCGSTPLINKSGLDFALQKEWKAAGGYGKEFLGEMTSKSTGKTEANTRWFAIAAFALAVLGLLTCLGAPRGATMGSVFGILAAGALIALMVDLNKWFNNMLAKEAAEKAKQGTDSLGLDKLGNVNPTLAFTPWSYIAIAVLLAAAYFCYRRMADNRT